MFLAPLVAVVFSGLIVGYSSMDGHADHSSSVDKASHASHVAAPSTRGDANDKETVFSIHDYMPPVFIYNFLKKMQS